MCLCDYEFICMDEYTDGNFNCTMAAFASVINLPTDETEHKKKLKLVIYLA